MTTPEVAKDIFKEVQAAFPQIVGAPNNYDVKRLTEALINALQSIDVPGGAIDLSELLMSDDKHEEKHGVRSVFERMSVPLPPYDDSIASDATNAVRAKVERLWTAKIGLQTLIKTVERAGRTFLIAGVEDTWLLPLKEEILTTTRFRYETSSRNLKAAAAASKPLTLSPYSRTP